jgi:hypothetical protein
MDPTRDCGEDGRHVGPTLYLESGELDSPESFCTEVFDDEAAGEYRIVQLTSTQSFESLHDSLNAHLERIHDPSEAAIVITTPQAEEESTVTRVGEGTPLYGFRVDPQDLTGISVAFTRLIDRWGESEGSTKICLRDVESLLPYHDEELVYRFLNTILATLQGAGADVHVHLRPAATDERTLSMLQSLFARVVDPDDANPDSPAGAASEAADSSSATDLAAPDESGSTPESGGGDARPTMMSDDEIDAFLEREGYGVLAFGGDSPYAIPMSFGYDAADRLPYLQLSSYEGSEKRARLTDSESVSLVVTRYEQPDRWRSVVVDGSLSRLAADRTREAVEAFTTGKLASVDVFERDLADVSFDLYVLAPSDVTGRQSVRSI